VRRKISFVPNVAASGYATMKINTFRFLMQETVVIETTGGSPCVLITMTTDTKEIGRHARSVVRWRNPRWWLGTGQMSTTGKKCQIHLSLNRRSVVSAEKQSAFHKAGIRMEKKAINAQIVFLMKCRHSFIRLKFQTGFQMRRSGKVRLSSLSWS
jgi:hypothetical protein